MEVFDLTHVAFILALAFLGGLFLQHLRQPAIVGYIIVGAIIGPGLLGLQGDTAAVAWLAELALVLLMFMLGLELDVKKFKSAVGTGVWVASLQVIVGVSVMTSLAVFLDWSLATAVLFGFIIALSSTAVAVTMLDELHEEDREAGRIATAILIAQDILFIPMLLVVSAMSGGGFDTSDLFGLGASFAVIVLAFFVIFEITRHPEWVERAERLFAPGTTQPVIAGMALCFGAAAISGALGLSTAFGAFALGLLLGNVGQVGASYRKAVHSIHDLLMMVFFLSVGLLLDLVFLWENIFKVLVILGVAVFLKTILTMVILRLSGTPKREAYTLAAVLGQIGEFSFVLIALGLSNGFINNETYHLGLSVIALSLVISPLWLSVVKNIVGTPSDEIK